MFSARTHQHEAPNALTRLLAERRATGAPLLDLTASNPTTIDLPYDAASIGAAFAAPAALVYEPAALGLPAARATVAATYTREGYALAADRIAITASTSEAYAVLFKMLCDPGDEILVPTPSYPLLSWLADFESVVLRPYPLHYAGGWHVDREALARAKTSRTRAIVVVTPNNPTGSYLRRDDLDAMLDLGLPIVSDEVFAAYPVGATVPEDRVASVVEATRGLVFALSGLSKLVALPQMKLGWIAVAGDDGLARDAIARLDVVLDAYLSVAAPVQHALPELLRAGEVTREAIRERVRDNLAFLRGAVRETAASLLDVEGGWYATLRIPATRTDEEWALLLVAAEGVHVFPGYFFDMTDGAHVVLSLITPSAIFREGVARLLRRVTEDAA